METFDIVKRSEKVAFYGIEDEFVRMQGFTSMSTSKNPEEHSVKYVDEDSKRNSVIGYDTQISYSFERIKGNLVHEDIAEITDMEKIGIDAVRTIIVVDTATKKAIKRDFAVIPDSEGDDENLYTYSGTFKTHGSPVFGTAVIDEDGMGVTFTADAG